MNKYKVFNLIDDYIRKLDISKSKPLPQVIKDEKVDVDGKGCFFNLWHEEVEGKPLIVLQINKKSLLMDEVYTKGVLINGTKISVLSNEEMWVLGF